MKKQTTNPNNSYFSGLFLKADCKSAGATIQQFNDQQFNNEYEHQL